MGRLTTVFLLALATGSGILARHTPILTEPAEAIDMQQSLFTSGGTLELKDSMGDVEIVGWDQPQVEVTVRKFTERTYAPQEMEKALAQLERIVVRTDQVADDHLVIRTEFPSWNLFTRLLGGKSNVHLSYTIRVPKQTRLIIRHDVGEVRVHDVAANMDVTARIGDIDVNLPDDERYTIDAKAHIGDVSSDWCPAAQRYSAEGEMLPDAIAHRVTLRVGVGDITVRKSRREFTSGSFEG
jgi:predicted membrane protein